MAMLPAMANVTVILANPLGAVDAVRVGLSNREYAIGESITINSSWATSLLGAGYLQGFGAAPTTPGRAFAPLLRRKDSPGVAGLPVAMASPPTITLSAANAGIAISNPQSVTEQDARVRVFGAHLSRGIDSSGGMPDSTTPFDGNSFQTYRVGLVTDAPTIEFQFRAVSGKYRIWVNGQPTSLTATTDSGGGAFYRASVAFGSRAVRHVEFEAGETRITQIVVGVTDTLFPVPKRGPRGVIIGDSYVEGTGATSRFQTWAHTFAQLAGWSDAWISGSGGTGYLNPSTASGRVKFRSRIVADCLQFNPDYVMISGGRNDVGYSTVTAGDVQAEALALFQQIRSALPAAQLFVTGVFPASATEAADSTVLAFNSAIAASAAAVSATFLNVMGSSAYITGTGKVGSTNGSGNADWLTFSDGNHPSQAGHDVLGHVMFERYMASLTV